MVRCINAREIGAVTILDLDGEIRTGGSRAELHDTIVRLVEGGHTRILLNLDRLSAIDASGLGELISCHVTLLELGGQLKVLHTTRALREMMRMTKLLAVFDLYENEAEALASFSVPAADHAETSSILQTHRAESTSGWKLVSATPAHDPSELTKEKDEEKRKRARSLVGATS